MPDIAPIDDTASDAWEKLVREGKARAVGLGRDNMTQYVLL